MRTTNVLVVTAAAGTTLGLLLTGCGSAPGRATTPATVRGGAQAVLTAAAAAAAAAGRITTTGTGTISGTPDTMTVAINVSTTDQHAAPALAHNNAAATAVQQVLERDGVAAPDIQTSGLSLQQVTSPSPAGYQVDDEVTATLRDLTKAGSVIDDAVAAAGDAGRLDGVSFSMSDTSPLLAAARQQAVAAARTEAEQLAAAAGEHLGALVSLTDQSDLGQPVGVGLGIPSMAPAAVPVRPGTQQLSVAVTAVWAVGP
ncbi:MAG TPA: SIMPL domain-containing protein [Acidimicrobiales bacterium]